MIPVKCRVKHDPENHQYGDCVRACIASVMELDAENVPHFFHDDCDGETGNMRIRDWLRGFRLVPFWVNYPGELALADLMEMMGILNPDVHYILYGGTGEGDHVVVCKGAKVVNNPAWYGSTIIEPGSHGFWSVLVIARA